MSVGQSTPPAVRALIDSHEPPLSAPLTLSFDYTRSVGSTLGAFFTALRSRRIVGVRGSDGRVHVPVIEYDPVTYEPLTEIVPVASTGTVLSWAWQAGWRVWSAVCLPIALASLRSEYVFRAAFC